MNESVCVAGDHEGEEGGPSGAPPGVLLGLPAGADAPFPPRAFVPGGRQWVADPLAGRGVAHDLNNLLTLIAGHAEIALSTAGEGSALRTSLEQIVHAADIGASLAGQWLRAGREANVPLPREAALCAPLAGGRQCVPVVTGINPIVRNALDIFQPLLPPDISLQLELAPGLWPAAADPVAIEEAIINLVDNAREAMPSGGTLTVSTENVVVGDGGWPGAPDARPGRWVCVTVADTGVGMDRSTLDHIFEPYFTAKPGGTGLGLPMVRRIAQEHGGWLAVTSESGRGTTAQVFLPI
ncbi:MAG: hypothetical protein FJ290_01620 [Planctomycetes bacterium]|nr:hypothetical protein [Planctomycetota bacterium]